MNDVFNVFGPHLLLIALLVLGPVLAGVFLALRLGRPPR